MVRGIRVRKGLEPLIAAIILIAVTLVIAIAVAAWLMGLFGSQGSTESLVVYPNATLTASSKQLQVWVLNNGPTTVVVDSIRLNVPNCTAALSATTISSGAQAKITTDFSSAPGCNLIQGVSYNVYIVTRAGNVYMTSVTAS